MTSLGFKKSAADPSLYVKREDGKVIILVLAYIDNNITAGPDHDKILEFKRKFHEILDTPRSHIHSE